MNITTLKESVVEALHVVKDPEIPAVSIGELGMLFDIQIEENRVHVKLIPTFVGCPALDIISREVKNAITSQIAEIRAVDVTYVLDESWSTERITDEGREKLKKFGIAPPPSNYIEGEPWKVDCPFCGSIFTSLDNVFGPAACRSILYCKSCKNPFEAMKPVVSY